MNLKEPATLTHLNVRKSKDDELLVDCRWEVGTEGVALAEFHGGLHHVLWDMEGRPRFATVIEAFRLQGKLPGHDVRAVWGAINIDLDDSTLSKFEVVPLALGRMSMEFTSTWKASHPGREKIIGDLGVLLKQTVELHLTENGLALTPAAEKFAKGIADGSIGVKFPDGTTIGNFPDAPKKERKKRPGGNRRPAGTVNPDPAQAKSPPGTPWPWPQS